MNTAILRYNGTQHSLLSLIYKTQKTLYFQRKHKEKYVFPLIIETFLLYLQRKLIKSMHLC